MRFTTDCPYCERELAAFLPRDTTVWKLEFPGVVQLVECEKEDGGCGNVLAVNIKMDRAWRVMDRWFKVEEV